MRVDPAPEPDQQGLVGLETGVDLDGQVGGRGEDAEKDQREVALDTGQLGLDDRGAIEAGRRADLVALDADLRVESVWIGGVEAPLG